MPTDGGGGDGRVTDGGGGDFAPEPPRIDWLEEGRPPVVPPAPPRLGACSTGYREVEVDGAVRCEPWPSGGPAACADHEGHFVGEAECAVVGTTCPADGLPAAPTTGDVLYVRSGATGDGSRGAPLGTISDALSIASPGTVVAIGTGRYAENVSVGPDVMLLGACAEGTIVEGTISFASVGGAARNLTVSGDDASIVIRARAALEDVVVRDVRGVGIHVLGAAVDAESVVVRRVAPGSSTPGHGWLIDGGSVVTLSRALVEAASGDGIHAGGSSRSELGDVAVIDADGHGLLFEAGAAAAVSRAAVERTGEAGLRNVRSDVSVNDLVIRQTGMTATGRAGQGIFNEAGTLVATRAYVSQSRFAGVQAFGGELTLSDALVVDTAPDETLRASGYGLVATGGTIDVRRVRMARNTYCSVLAQVTDASLEDVDITDTYEAEPDSAGDQYGCGVSLAADRAELHRLRVAESERFGMMINADAEAASVVDASDLEITSTRASPSDGGGGQGLLVVGGVTLTAERVVVDGAQSSGIQIRYGAAAHLRDVLSRRGQNAMNFGIGGYGMRAMDDASMTIERALVEEASVAAIHVLADASLVATDVLARDTLGEEMFGLHGWGLGVTDDATATLTRVSFERNRYLGIVSSGAGSRVLGTDVSVSETREARCAIDLCEAAPFGIGLGAYSGASVELSRFLITESHVIGVQLAGGAAIDLERGIVSRAPVGANVQSDDFQVDRLTRDVSYVDNQQNLVTDALPVPSVSGLD